MGGSNLQLRRSGVTQSGGLSLSTSSLLPPAKGAFTFFCLLLGVKTHLEEVWNISAVPYSYYFPTTTTPGSAGVFKYGWTGYARAHHRCSNR